MTSSHDPVDSVRLFEALLDAETCAARERVRADGLRSRRHDMANALTAVEGAASILQHESSELSASDRSMLARVLASGFRSLRRMLAEDADSEESVSLADAVAAVGQDPAARARIASEVGTHLIGRGSRYPIEEALRELLGYVGGTDGDGPISVHGYRDGAELVLRIADCRLLMGGHSFRLEVDEHRRRPGWDEAIGVYVAARLIREQGGSLWLESGPGAKPSFVVHLRAM